MKFKINGNLIAIVNTMFFWFGIISKNNIVNIALVLLFFLWEKYKNKTI